MDEDESHFTRHDFLRVDTYSIKSENNNLIYAILKAKDAGRDTPRTKTNKKPMDEDVESWEDWRTYPSFDNLDCFTKGDGLELMGFLVHNFGVGL